MKHIYDREMRVIQRGGICDLDKRPLKALKELHRLGLARIVRKTPTPHGVSRAWELTKAGRDIVRWGDAR